jgi:hypothetical protein
VAPKVVGFGEDDLKALAGTRSFERGLGYLDAVSGLEVGEGSYLMERLVKAEGDVDALVTLYEQGLDPSGATHLRIAEELESAGRADEALAWAERGLRDCAARHTSTVGWWNTCASDTRRRGGRPTWSGCAGTGSVSSGPWLPTSNCAPLPGRRSAGG